MSTKTTKHLIDWDAYRQLVAQTQPKQVVKTETQTPSRASPGSTQPNGADALNQLAEKVEKRAQTLALGHLGQQLGDWQGAGEAPVEKKSPPQQLFSAWKTHDDLRQKLGDRLAQQFSLRWQFADKADSRQHQLQMQQLKEDRQDQRKRQQQLLNLASQTVVETLPDAAVGQTKSADNPRKPKREQPFRITDTDGQQVYGYWELSPDEAAQILQTAIDLGDSAQIDYVAQLAGAGSGADQRTTTAKLMALQQKALMGNADARQRMARLLTAIVPSLKGRKVIDGILNRGYRKSGNR